MNKFLRISIISFLSVLFIFCSNCFAVNIDMNLNSDLVDSNTSVENSNSLYSYSEQNEETTYSNTLSSSHSTSSSTSNKNSSVADTLQALPESELGLTNIINILLIAVGFVLILLAIAIFIRLKK